MHAFVHNNFGTYKCAVKYRDVMKELLRYTKGTKHMAIRNH